MNWYQQIPTPGWQTPPPVPPVQKKEKEPLSPEKKDRRAAFWLKIVAVLLVLILDIFIITYVPGFITWLPKTLGMTI